MEDYEVREVSRRLDTPDLYLSFRMEAADPLPREPGTAERYGPVNAEVVVGNRSPAAAIFALLRYCVDMRLLHGERDDNSVQVSGRRIDVVSRSIEWRGGFRLPLWETILFKLATSTLSIPKAGGPFYMFWDAQSPMMERKAGTVSIEVADDKLSFKEECVDWQYDKQIVHQT